MASQVERKRRRRRKEMEALLGISTSSSSISAPKQHEMHLLAKQEGEANEDRLGNQHQFRQQHCKVRSGGPSKPASTCAIHVRSSRDGPNNNYCHTKPNHFKMSTLLLSSSRATTLAAFTISIAILLLVNLISCPASASTSASQPQSQPTGVVTGAAAAAAAATTTVIQAPGSSSKGRYRTMYACEDRQLNMDCEPGFKINLIRANFGRFSIQQCNEQGQLDLSIDCMSPNSFRIMNERCQGRQKCFVNATSAIFTDKCPKTRKYLEVHFQCQPDETPRVDLRTTPSPQINGIGGPNHQLVPLIDPPSSIGSSSSILPPNNPKQHQFLNHQPMPEPPRQASAGFNQQPAISTVINSDAVGQAQTELKSIFTSQGTEQRLLVTFQHKHVENMRNPRCVFWDNSTWSDKGSLIYFTNYTHTTCAYDILATSYLLVMDHVGPMQPEPTMLSTQQQPQQQPSLQPHFQSQPQPQLPSPASPLPPPSSNMNQQQSPINSGPYPEILEQLTPIDLPSGGYPQLVPRHHSEPATAPASSMMRVVSLFGYVLAIVFAIVALTTIALIGSNMRSSAGAALKSLGNFSAFNGAAKYKGSNGGGGVVRRSLDGGHNKDLLVINNQNGHQFLYAPAQTTKINSSSSTHILNTSTMPGQHQNTLHQIQQQQLYSGTNGTLSNLSGTGGQSNNYYYGLMGFNSLFQHQQQSQQLQHHLSQHHLNQQLQQQQQMPQVSSYQHQANKSTISNESANSSPSSSGVESGNASVQQQQQQQSCLMMNNDYNLMSQLASYGQGGQQQTPAAAISQQPTLTLNAHYSSSGTSPLLQAANQQRLNQQQQLLMNSPAAQLREHIYECVDDDKPYGARMLIGNQLDDQLFNTANLSHAINQQQQQQRSMTLSSRLLQSAYQQQHLQPIQVQQQQQQNNASGTSKRLSSHPAIIRDNQATKTNIICSKLAQVTPQRATEINKFQHDVMAIYNSNCDTTTTSTTTAGTSSAAASSCYGMAREEIIGQQPQQQHQVKNKLSTDC